MILDPRETYLFLFAHPDDDVFIAGTMRLLLDAGAQVYAAWLTSGDYLGQGRRREVELTKATAILGLDPNRTRLLRFPDLGLIGKLSEAASKVAELLHQIKPTVVVANAYEGGHPDHDCVNFLAYEASSRARMAPKLHEFPLYNGAGSPLYGGWQINRFPPGGPPVEYVKLNDRAVECKHRMMWTYSSQLMFMIPARLATSRARMLRYGEPSRRCPADRDHSLPPHQGEPNYERWFNAFMKTKFDDFRKAVKMCRAG